MKLNMSNPTEAIYLNIFALAQNIELQLMATWVHLSTYLLFAIYLPPFNFFNTERTVFRKASVRHTDLKSPGRQKQPLEVFCRKRFSLNFLKFTRKNLCQSFFFNQVVG